MCVNCPPRSKSYHDGTRAKSWSIERSYFKARKIEAHSADFWDDHDYLSRIFDSDWTLNKLNRVVKNEVELDLIKVYLKDLFTKSILSNIYQLYSVFSTERNSVNMVITGFSNMCKDFAIIDDKVIGLKDIDMVFIATNVETHAPGDAYSDSDSIKSLDRFELVECLTRLAIKKYLDSAVVQRASEAVEALFTLNILPALERTYLSYFPTLENERDQWFGMRNFLYTEHIDFIFAEHMSEIIDMFNAFAENLLVNITLDGGKTLGHVKIKTLHGVVGSPSSHAKRKGLTFSRLCELLSTLGMFSECFTRKDARLAFICSKMFVENEMETREHTICSFTDFLEFIARMTCLKSMYIHYSEDSDSGSDSGSNNEDEEFGWQGVHHRPVSQGFANRLNLTIKEMVAGYELCLDKGRLGTSNGIVGFNIVAAAHKQKKRQTGLLTANRKVIQKGNQYLDPLEASFSLLQNQYVSKRNESDSD
jgi:hypothetical protein